MKVLTATIAAVIVMLTAGTAAADRWVETKRPSLIATTQLAVWQCQDHLTGERTRASLSPWALPKSETYRIWVHDLWKQRLADCKAALKEKKRQWNWQVFPSWIIQLARCETSINWFAEGSSSHGLFYSAFNIGRSRYDIAAHRMGVRGWREGKGVPSPYEQAMAVIGYVRIYGDGFTGRCHGIARSSW